MASLLEIEIASHYWCNRVEDYGSLRGNFNAPAVQATLRDFVERGVLVYRPRLAQAANLTPGTISYITQSQEYSIGPKLQAFIEALEAVKLPAI